MRAALVCLTIWLAAPVSALDLPLPEASEQTADVMHEAGTIRLPTGTFKAGMLPRLNRDGDIHSRAWRLPARGMSTLQMLSPLRGALDAAGWETVLACADEECGGFDFRLALPVLPAPAMFVDLFDYRYLLVRRGMGAQTEHVALIVSRRGRSGYVQITHVLPLDEAADHRRNAISVSVLSETSGADLAQTLRDRGYVVMGGLDFGSGASTLGPGPHPSIDALAAFLLADPATRVALVGHTDSVGGLDANRNLSRSRAEVVRQRLINDHGVPSAQVEAHGIGYLAPRGPNSTAADRDRNRRVEAVLLETQEP